MLTLPTLIVGLFSIKSINVLFNQIICKDRQRAPKKTPTLKAGFECTAHMSVKKLGTSVLVKYCSDHYGHDTNVNNKSLSTTTREFVANSLEDSRSIKWIVDKCNFIEHEMNFQFLNLSF